MISMNSVFRLVYLALLGALLAAYALLHELNGHCGAGFHHLVATSPTLKAMLFIPPAIVVGIAGLVMLAVPIYRLRILWHWYRISRQRHGVSGANRNNRRTPAAAHSPAEQEFDENEFGPMDSYDGPPPGYRGHSQFDPQRAESHR
jgi:hypothetical protein